MTAVSPPPRRRFGVGLGELSGAVADLGVLVPLVAALVLVNGLDGGAVLLGAGLLAIASGAWFGLPWPVQPLKALTAVAVAQQLAPEVIHTAGLLVGVVLLALSLRGVADRIAAVFTATVVRALQVGVGVLLIVTALRLVARPPEVFAGVPPTPWPLLLALVAFAGVVWAARTGRHGLALAVLAGGLVAVIVTEPPGALAPQLALPGFALPSAAVAGQALVLLVIPQIPLTFGNAIVAVGDVAHRTFGEQAARVTPSRICVSAGLGNVVAALLGGMPMCHGAGGLTAHLRLGARTAGMNLVLGGGLVVVGLWYGADVAALLGLLPVWALAAFLAYAGLRHALLAADLRGARLVLAVGAGLLGAALGNLAVTTGVALVADHGLRAAERRGLVRATAS